MKHVFIEEEVKYLHTKGKMPKYKAYDTETGEEVKTLKPLQKLSDNKSVHLSQTLAGQRELIRQMKNKINLIIDWINKHE